MTQLWPHQQEVAALARVQSAALSCPPRAGKTFLASWLAAEAVRAGHAIAVAPTATDRAALRVELTRLCGARVVCSDDAHAAPATERWWTRGASADTPAQVSVLSPLALLEAVRDASGAERGPRALVDLALLVVEGFDQVHAELPAFFPAFFRFADQRRSGVRVFATTRQPCSKLDWRADGSPLFGRVSVLNVIPASVPRAPAAAARPILCEPFVWDGGEATAPTLDVKALMLGANSKQLDLVGVFRRELELGNSKANADEKLKQDRVSRLIADAEAVHAHLGLWCLWKFLELELQTNLLACTVGMDPHASRGERDRANSGGDVDMDASDDEAAPEEGEVVSRDAADEDEDEDARLFARVLGPDVELDASSRDKVRPIVKVIKWVGAQATKCGVGAASPRLRKTAEILRVRFLNACWTQDGSVSAQPERAGLSIRAWVFVVRRCHCRVVAEYLWAALADLHVPAPCSMLGNSNARVCGLPHFSSPLKVMNKFAAREATVLVTTAMKRSDPSDRVQPPLCDAVVVMDELLEPDKLLGMVSRVDPQSGAVVYVTGDSPPEKKQFELLKLKMDEYAQQLEADGVGAWAAPLSSGNVDMVEPLGSSSAAAAGSLPMTGGSLPVPATGAPSLLSLPPRPFPAAPSANEIRYADTGAVLNASNSVECLSSFCATLPGLDTYDRHPEYKVKRIPVATAMSESAKRYKKKKLKYNSKLNDKIDELVAMAAADDDDSENAADDERETRRGRFHYSATLRLPNCLGIRKQFVSPKVETESEAKGICAFHACQEVIRKGFLDRNFRSKLIDDESTIHREMPGPDSLSTSSSDPDAGAASSRASTGSLEAAPAQRLLDMSTQSSYDLPPVSAAELSLRPIRSLVQAAAAASETTSASASASASSPSSSPSTADDWTATMCLYALEGVQLAILATDELYTGNTNVGWRYDFAMCDVMDGALRRLTLHKKPSKITLSAPQLRDALHFHLITMRLACMTVADAVRDIDIAGDDVWHEFSEQNDKGYLVVPSAVDAATGAATLDWVYVREIIGQPLLEPAWPLPAVDEARREWICVPENRRNVTYVVEGVTEDKMPAIRAKYMPDDETWKAHLKKGRSSPGKPILGRWHSRAMLEAAEDDQPLLHGIQVPQIVPLIRRVMQRNLDAGSVAKLPTQHNERLLVPQYTQRLRLTRGRFFEAMGFVPVLYEFERKCQMSSLMTRIGLEIDMTLLDDATTKPAYERLEILGDTFLKLETSWFMFERRKDVLQEGFLTQLRRDIIRNDRLNQFAIRARLHHYMLYPAEVEQHPFECWKPSCMGRTPAPVVAPAKWVADVLEAICGAYLIDKGERGARHFLRWVGVSVLDEPHTFARPFYPDCVPNELYDDDDDGISSSGEASRPQSQLLGLNFRSAQFEDLPARLATLQQRLKYSFRNQRLLLEAITHPSIGQLVLHMDQMSGADAEGGGGGEEGGDAVVAVPAGSAGKKKKKVKSVWKGDYERLEYLGDAVIEYLTLSYAYLAHDKWQPGSLSQWKSATVSNDALGKTALAWFGIDECILTGSVRMDAETMDRVARIKRRYKSSAATTTTTSSLSARPKRASTSKSNGASSNGGASSSSNHTLPKMFADVFEALVAAVFLDSGRDLQRVRDVFMGPLLETVGKIALEYVRHESGLATDSLGEERMEELSLSSDLD